jgi:hypothetical protein
VAGRSGDLEIAALDPGREEADRGDAQGCESERDQGADREYGEPLSGTSA